MFITSCGTSIIVQGGPALPWWERQVPCLRGDHHRVIWFTTCATCAACARSREAPRCWLTTCGVKGAERDAVWIKKLRGVGKQISKLIPHLPPCHSNAQLHHDVRISVSQQLAACGPVSSVFVLCQFGAEKSLKLGYSKWAKCFQVLTVGNARKGKRAGFLGQIQLLHFML